MCPSRAAAAGIRRPSSPGSEDIMATKLYYAPGACSLASHIALEEIGIPYQTQPLNLAEGDQRKPEYLKINPRGRVPALVVDDEILTENVGIMTYLAGGHPKAGIWPK